MTNEHIKAVQEANAFFILLPLVLIGIIAWGNILIYPTTQNHGGSQ